jgi:putative methanogenesis marker protein 12
MTRTVQELFDLTGRTAIVTGGGTHLGTAFTEALGDLGAKVFDEISSGLKAVVIPGLHRGIRVLDERFRVLYSHIASSEKVSLCYHVHLATRARSFVVADVSTNTVTVAVKGGKFYGGVDACLGAPGLEQGPLDLELLRKVDAGELSANEAFSRAGVAARAGVDPRALLRGEGRDAVRLDALATAVKMEVEALASLVDPEIVAIAGWAGSHPQLSLRLEKLLSSYTLRFFDEWAAAMGSAEIARDILKGRRDFLGIRVGSLPEAIF